MMNMNEFCFLSYTLYFLNFMEYTFIIFYSWKHNGTIFITVIIFSMNNIIGGYLMQFNFPPPHIIFMSIFKSSIIGIILLTHGLNQKDKR